MKILYLNPGYSDIRSDPWIEHYKKILQNAAGYCTNIHVGNLGTQNYILNGYEDHIRYNITDILKSVIDAEKKGFDAIIIGCASDPGVKSAKKLVNIPVLGISEVGVNTANILNKNWSIIIPGPFERHRLTYPFMYPWMEDIGIEKISFRVADIYGTVDGEEKMKLSASTPESYNDLIQERFTSSLKHEIPELAKDCYEKDGTEVILLGCTMWSGWDKKVDDIFKKFKFIILDPVITALKTAENLVEILKK